MANNSTLKLVKIGEAAKQLGVSIDTLRRWEKAGKLQAIRTPGGTRLYDASNLTLPAQPTPQATPKSVQTPQIVSGQTNFQTPVYTPTPVLFVTETQTQPITRHAELVSASSNFNEKTLKQVQGDKSVQHDKFTTCK